MSSSEMSHQGSDRQAPARRPLFGTVAAAFFAGVLVLAACEGDNLFSGGPQGGLGQTAPKVGTIEVPASVAEGSRLDVRVKAIAPAGMDKIDVRFRRAVSGEESITITGNRTDTVTADASINIPSTVNDSVVLVEAFATDRNGRVSEVVSRTVRVESRTLPTVTASVSPSGNVSLGDTLRIRVSAKDIFGLRSIGYAILNEAGDTIGGPQFVTVSGVVRDTLFAVRLPSGVPVGKASVIGIAVNNQLLRGVSVPLSLELVDLRGPAVQLLTPQQDESFPLGDSIFVRAQVVDSGGVAEIRMKGVAIRRDSLQNTVVVERFKERIIPFPQPPSTSLPKDTTVQRYLLPAADTTSEPVHIIVTTRDKAGNTTADTARIIDGPRAIITNPTNGALVGLNSTMLVRIAASDRLSGLDSVKLIVGGVQNMTVVLRNLNRPSLDTTIAVPTGATSGPMTLRAGVWNRQGVGGLTQAITVTVAQQSTVDNERPQVLRLIQTSERVELDDSIHITVRASDGSGSGIRRFGLVIVATPDVPSLPSRTFFRTTPAFVPPVSGTPERVFEFTLGEGYGVTDAVYPRKFTLQVHAFAIDEAGNCGASVTTTMAAAVCDTLIDNGVTYHSARGQAAAQLQLTAVAGQSVSLPGGGKIADALVDAARRRVYLSNITANRIDIFNLGPDTFDITGSQPGACGGGGGGVSSCRGTVGAAPWGLFINNAGDSLIVANSGGTNISFMQLDGPNYLHEHVSRRLLTPNVVLWGITGAINNGFFRLTRRFYDFSDRPQFVAQHSSGTLVYSTVPTLTAGAGTIRVADTNPDPGSTIDLPESYIMYPGNAVRESEDSWAIANIDSVVVVRSDTTDDRVILFDHKPGYYDQPGRPGQNLIAGPLPLLTAAADLQAQGSDVIVYAGAWDLTTLTMTDTTFIASSTDRSTIAFGEGGTQALGRAGRVMMCCSVNPGPPLRVGISDVIAVTDLLNNASERVLGLGLNQNGSLGVARGAQAAYFFTPDLRLQGEFRSGVAGGAGGAALHPDHAATLEAGDRALSFVATPDRTVKIIDTAHFFERGEIAIRDNIVGPLRTALPAPSENAGLQETDPNFIVVKLVGVTAGDNVVIVNVRRKDVGG